MWDRCTFQSPAFMLPGWTWVVHAPLGLIWNVISSVPWSEPCLQGLGRVNEQVRLDTKIIMKLEFYLSFLIKDIDTEIFSYHKERRVWVRCVVATDPHGLHYREQWGLWGIGCALLKRVASTLPWPLLPCRLVGSASCY